MASRPVRGFSTQFCFFSRPGCLGLNMKNRVKSGFSEADKFISNVNVFSNIKITLYYSVCMRTSVEKVHYRMKDEAGHVQSVSYPRIRSLSGLYT